LHTHISKFASNLALQLELFLHEDFEGFLSGGAIRKASFSAQATADISSALDAVCNTLQHAATHCNTLQRTAK